MEIRERCVYIRTGRDQEGRNGRDIRKYLFGGFEFDSYCQADSKYECIKLIQERQVGRLPLIQFLLAPNPQSWMLIDRKILNDTILCAKFSAPYAKVHALLPGVRYFGLYVVVGSEQKNIERNYSLSFVLEQNLYQRHLYGRDIQKGKIIRHGEVPSIDSLISDSVTLFVRKKGVLSSHIHTTPFHSHLFSISGLYGPGLQISPYENGTIIGMGIGISSIIFVDLVAYLLRMDGLQKSAGQYPMYKNEDFPPIGSQALNSSSSWPSKRILKY